MKKKSEIHSNGVIAFNYTHIQLEKIIEYMLCLLNLINGKKVYCNNFSHRLNADIVTLLPEFCLNINLIHSPSFSSSI